MLERNEGKATKNVQGRNKGVKGEGNLEVNMAGQDGRGFKNDD